MRAHHSALSLSLVVALLWVRSLRLPGAQHARFSAGECRRSRAFARRRRQRLHVVGVWNVGGSEPVGWREM